MITSQLLNTGVTHRGVRATRVSTSSSLLLFFFSSRRRHTRFDCDWSSDVCSSDLPVLAVEEHNASGREKSFCATDTLADSVDTAPRILDSFSTPCRTAAFATSFLMRDRKSVV